MRSFEERMGVLEKIMNTAHEIACHDPACAAGQAAREYLQFCVRHGYAGRPTDSPEAIVADGYLQPGRSGCPTTPAEAAQSLGIIVCFSDEIMPCNPTNKVTTDGTHIVESAYVSPKDRILVIWYVDWHTPVELALTLLHEARHARQYFGGEFEKLPVLDPDEIHESQTWKHELDLLDACGGRVWQKAVNQESAMLHASYAHRGRSPGEKYLAMSSKPYPTLDQVFGIPLHPSAYGHRKLLVAMRANFRLAENAQLPDLNTAYANIVDAYYSWCRKNQ